MVHYYGARNSRTLITMSKSGNRAEGTTRQWTYAIGLVGMGYISGWRLRCICYLLRFSKWPIDTNYWPTDSTILYQCYYIRPLRMWVALPPLHDLFLIMHLYIYMSLLVDWVALMHLLHFFFNRKCSSSPSFAYQIRCDLNLSREGIRQTNSPIRKALWSFLLYSFAFSSPLLLLNSSNIKRRVTLTLPLHATFWKDFHFTFLK